MHRALVISIFSCIVTSAAAAQRSGANKTATRPDSRHLATCTVNSSDAWVKRQVVWFDESKHDWSNDSLRATLLAAAGLEASLKAPVQNGVRVDGQAHKFGPTADAVTQDLMKLAATRGSTWPTRSVVGPTGTHAVYLLASRDTALGRAALHRMMEAGPDESPAADVATLEDQLRLAWGRKQLYGTQFEIDASGKVRLKAMEDTAHADLRREGAGLPPFQLGICLAAGSK
jgi:hypothetical protein